MFRVIVRRSTRTIRSITGISRIRPGPFWAIRRPRRKMTPRSYSRRTRIAEPTTIRRKKATTTAMPIAIAIRLLLSLGFRLPDGTHQKRQPVDLVDQHSIARPNRRRSIRHPRLPEGALDEDLTDRVQRLAHLRFTPDQLLPAGPH